MYPSSHAASPCAELPVSAEHAVQDPFTIMNPALHLHSALPSTESALASHALHFISEGAPSSDEYFPLAQDSQSSAEVAAHTLEYFPCGHASQFFDPVDENFPLRHSLHDELVAAPSRSEYLPASHGRQLELVDAPSVLEYVPRRHFLQKSFEVDASRVEKVPRSQDMQSNRDVLPVLS